MNNLVPTNNLERQGHRMGTHFYLNNLVQKNFRIHTKMQNKT